MTYTMDGWVVEPDYDAWLEEQYEEQYNAYMEEQQQRDYEAWVLKYGDPPEADEREALTRGQRYAATHPEARSSRSQGLLAAGFRDGYVSGYRRSQPAPRTVSAAEVERLTAEVATRHLQYLTVQGVADGERAAHIICDDSLKDAQDRIARALAVLDDAGSWGAQDGLVQRSDLRAILTGTDD